MIFPSFSPRLARASTYAEEAPTSSRITSEAPRGHTAAPSATTPRTMSAASAGCAGARPACARPPRALVSRSRGTTRTLGAPGLSESLATAAATSEATSREDGSGGVAEGSPRIRSSLVESSRALSSAASSAVAGSASPERPSRIHICMEARGVRRSWATLFKNGELVCGVRGTSCRRLTPARRAGPSPSAPRLLLTRYADTRLHRTTDLHWQYIPVPIPVRIEAWNHLSGVRGSASGVRIRRRWPRGRSDDRRSCDIG